MIEVGWDAGDDVDPPSEEAEGNPIENLAPAVNRLDPSIEEPIDDRYAALQARAERERYAGRASIDEATPDRHHDRTDDGESEDSPSSPSVWAEGEHGFKPYSQLFSRVRQTRDSQ